MKSVALMGVMEASVVGVWVVVARAGAGAAAGAGGGGEGGGADGGGDGGGQGGGRDGAGGGGGGGGSYGDGARRQRGAAGATPARVAVARAAAAISCQGATVQEVSHGRGRGSRLRVAHLTAR